MNHACESGHSLAGRCQVSLPPWEAWLHALRWHLRLPNVVQSFLSKSTDQFLFRANKKAHHSQKTGYISFSCVCVISTLHLCVNDKDKKFAFSCLNCPLYVVEALPLAFQCLLQCVSLTMWSLTRVHVVWIIRSFVSGYYMFVFKG